MLPLRPRPLLPLAALLVLALLPLGCGKRETVAEAGRRTGTLHLALNSEPGELDPQR